MTMGAEAFTQAVRALAYNAVRMNPGEYWQQFLLLASRTGVSAGELATYLATIAPESAEFTAALNGLRNVIASGITAGMPAAEAAAVETAVVSAEGLVAAGATTVGVAGGVIAEGSAAGSTIAGGSTTAGGGAVAAGLSPWIIGGVIIIVIGGVIYWATTRSDPDEVASPAATAPADPDVEPDALPPVADPSNPAPRVGSSSPTIPAVEVVEFENPLYVIHVIRRYTTDGPRDTDSWVLAPFSSDGQITLADLAGGSFTYDTDASLGPAATNIEACTLAGVTTNIYIPTEGDFAICS